MGRPLLFCLPKIGDCMFAYYKFEFAAGNSGILNGCFLPMP